MFTGSAAVQRGLSLVELIVFIVVVGAAVAGVTMAFTASTRSSADPLIQKQALAIAEAMLEEVQLQPFTYCDPNHDNAATATGAGDCPGADENNLTPEAVDVPPTGPAETRYQADRPFDNVNDYNGFDSATAVPSGIRNIGGASIAGLDAYRVQVSVTGQALGPGAAPPLNIPAAESLLITVTVTGPANTTVVLQGYRTRYAPNALP